MIKKFLNWLLGPTEREIAQQLLWQAEQDAQKKRLEEAGVELTVRDGEVTNIKLTNPGPFVPKIAAVAPTTEGVHPPLRQSYKGQYEAEAAFRREQSRQAEAKRKADQRRRDEEDDRRRRDDDWTTSPANPLSLTSPLNPIYDSSSSSSSYDSSSSSSSCSTSSSSSYDSGSSSSYDSGSSSSSCD